MATNGKTELPVRWSPFKELEEAFPSLFERRWPFERPFFRRVMRLAPEMAPVDMFERDGNVIVKAEMPGIDKDQIEVSVVGNELRLSGERKEEKEIEEEDYYCSERTYGRVYRSMTLPEGCDTEHVTATMKDGVLEVVIPRKQAVATKKIEVKTA